MAEVGISGACDDLTIDLAELIDAVTERDDLGGTDEGEVQGVEEKDHVLPCNNTDIETSSAIGKPPGYETMLTYALLLYVIVGFVSVKTSRAMSDYIHIQQQSKKFEISIHLQNLNKLKLPKCTACYYKN